MDLSEPTATESVCPECLRTVPARRVAKGDDVYLVKTCPQHGESKTIIWRGPPRFDAWYQTKPASRPTVTQTERRNGCPRDCGLCPEHRQGSCCVLLEISQRCDLCCPLCFASSGTSPAADPGLDEIESWYRLLLESTGTCNIQLSGGEPTMRDDLPEIIALGRRMGFSFFQLNTNGLRLASDPAYGALLKQAGLSTVFLQFDGLSDETYTTLRGRPLLAEKKQAIANCAAARLGVVLVPTLVPGVNIHEIGPIIEYAIGRLPHVRGVHFQPVSYFGRYPRTPLDRDRYTLPELMRAVESQTRGVIPLESLRASGCEHSLCSFHGNYVLMPDDSVRPLGGVRSPGGAGSSGQCSCRQQGATPAERKRSVVARRWSPSDSGAAAKACCGAAEQPPAQPPEQPVPDLDDFLDRIRDFSFSITAMAFQDAWNLDLERLHDCCLHVVKPGGKIVPFCSYNITDRAGCPLHRDAT